MDTLTPPTLPFLTFDELLAQERCSNAGHINRVRFFGALGFFALFVVLGSVMHLPGWEGAWDVLAPYSTLAGLVFWSAAKRPRIAHSLATLTIAFVDMPLVALLQYGTLATSPSPGGVAGFTLGVIALLVALGALSLARWQIFTTALMGAFLEVALQRAADIGAGAQVAAVLVVGLIGFTCMFASERLRLLVSRVHNEMVSLQDMQGQLVASAVARAKVQEEVAIAQHMQMSILPKRPQLEGLEIAAFMSPASEVGGDYYDVIPFDGGGWIGIGDVAGHGLHAGLVMLLVQSAMSALSRMSSLSTPSRLLPVLNEVVYHTVRDRLERTDHVTFTLLRYSKDGKVVFAGVHQTLLVVRASDGRVDMYESPGTWVGAMRDVSEVTSDESLTLNKGDMLVLYTDGITEAQNATHEVFDMERLIACLQQARTQSPKAMVMKVMDAVRAWEVRQEDDVTLLVLRYTGEAGAPPAS